MDRKSKLENLINLKKEKGSTRKPKYASRKLSIGLVSFMLGFTLLVSPTDSKAAEEVSSSIAETEAVADKSIKTTDTNEVNTSETDKNLEEKSGQESNEVQESKQDVVDKTGDLDSENSEDVASKESDSFKPSITEITVKEGDSVDDYQKAITNLPAGASLSISSPADTSVVGVSSASGRILFADGSSMDVSIPVNVTEKTTEKTIENDVTDTNAGEDLDISPEVNNINLFAAQPRFNETTVKTVIVKKGIGESDFNFAGIFGETPDTKVTLINEKDGSVQEATFNAEDGTITFENPVSMDDVKNGDVSIKFSGTSIAGKFIENESNASYDGTSKITTFTLTLIQYRNNDVVVTTVDRDKEASKNPETTPTSGKIKMTDGRDRKREVNIPTDNTETSVARRPNSRNIDDYNKGITVEVTNQENGFLVDRDGNKVYKPDEITPDPDGLKPTEINFTEKPLVATTNDAGDDTDYAKVTFIVGDKGKTPNETSKAVIKGVKHGGKITAPADPKGKKGYTFREWSNGGVHEVYNEDTKHEALFDVVAPTGQNITTALNSKPEAASAIANSADLPEGTKFAWLEAPDTSSEGAKQATVVVIYPDGSTKEVPVTVTVADSRKDNEKYTATATPIQKENGQATTADEVIGAVKTDYPADAEKQPEIKLKAGEKLPDGTVEGTHKVKVVVTYPDKTTEEVEVPVIVGKDTRNQADKNDPKPVEQAIETEVGKVPEAKSGIKDADQLTDAKQFIWSKQPDVSKVGGTTGTVLIQYKDGSTDEVEVPVTVVDSRKDNEKNPAVDPAKTEVKDKTKLTDEEKAKVVEEVKKSWRKDSNRNTKTMSNTRRTKRRIQTSN
ncbi:MAG: Rib/alpha-like domain-containing protein [Finegoldia magna]|uniref:Rib/alpha-like domain-containing protein n=1 Tax=Finegoldia magna TaxID=1260 RepID=UPI0029159A54|nr:Rib/alpha-like domain-containing protein [Finegoldia magna]MDU5700383.1 Rib/alpha-like domain-containing protein [Finegoldia magna]